MTQNPVEQVAGADILIVDDTPDNIRFLSSLLVKKGYKVRKALNGHMALIAAKTLTPDLILLDINMPEMDGYEVCRRLKQDDAVSSIPVIFLSAWDAAEDKVKAFQAGGIDYITKPFQFEEVLIRIHNQLTISNLQKQLQTQNSELKQVVKTLRKSQLAVVQQETLDNLSRLAIGVVDNIEPPLWQISSHLVSIQRTLPVLSQYFQPSQSELRAETLFHPSAISILPNLAQAVESMQAEAGQIRAILSALHQFADLNSTDVRSIDIHAAIDQMLLLLHPFFMRNPSRQIELVKDYGSLPPVTCYVNLFNQVMFNLLSRAIDALTSNMLASNVLANNSQAEAAAFQPTLRLKTEISDRETVLIYIQENSIQENSIQENSIQENSVDIPANSPDWFPGSCLNGLANLPIGVLVCQQIVAEIQQGHLTHQTLAQGSEFMIEIPVCFTP